MDKLIAIIFLVILSPFFIILYILVRFTSKGSFIFKQKRMGKNGKEFDIYKIRTMVDNAEQIKAKIIDKNEADGPVFKIRNDPRYTRIGRWLSRTGIDELPQLINIIKGDMEFVGPRPLPVNEAKKISKKYKQRFDVKPGITSLWVIEGAKHDSFNRWMKQDLEYVKNKSIIYDINICFWTVLMLFKLLWQNIKLKKG